MNSDLMLMLEQMKSCTKVIDELLTKDVIIDNEKRLSYTFLIHALSESLVDVYYKYATLDDTNRDLFEKVSKTQTNLQHIIHQKFFMLDVDNLPVLDPANGEG